MIILLYQTYPVLQSGTLDEDFPQDYLVCRTPRGQLQGSRKDNWLSALLALLSKPCVRANSNILTHSQNPFKIPDGVLCNNTTASPVGTDGLVREVSFPTRLFSPLRLLAGKKRPHLGALFLESMSWLSCLEECGLIDNYSIVDWCIHPWDPVDPFSVHSI